MGGYVGGRLISYRSLFLIGKVLQTIACLFLSFPSTENLYIALALFLAGSGMNLPCINMMLIQQFKMMTMIVEKVLFTGIMQE
ncbi:hypothetical protein fh0823_06700 [Francisella halioticida]|nr:hypothetical protein [Francisella halioticida]BCD90531.1 hypothetical protein fh0823_06700 [Francisella halioticida]